MIQPQTTVSGSLAPGMVDADTVFEPHGFADGLSSLPLQFDRQTRAIGGLGDLIKKSAGAAMDAGGNMGQPKVATVPDKGAERTPPARMPAEWWVEAQQGLFSAGMELLAAQVELAGRIASHGGRQFLAYWPASMITLVEQFQGAALRRRSPD